MIWNMESRKSKGIRQSNNPHKDLSNAYLKNSSEQNSDNNLKSDNSENIPNNKTEDEMIDFQAEKQNNSKNDGLIESQVSIDDVIQENEKLIEEYNKLEKERDDLKDQLIRKVAEFENFRKRTLKEKQDLIDFANAQLLFKLLDLVDNIEKAYNTTKSLQDYNALLRGLELIYQQANKIIQDENVSPIPIEVGDDFDVETQDALMTLDSDLPEGKVAQVLQKGYKIKDKVLRHAKVSVSNPKK